MLKILLLTVIILVICLLLMSVKVIFLKNGRFPNTHIEGNRALGKKGIYCAKTMDRLEGRRRNLYERLEETKNK